MGRILAAQLPELGGLPVTKLGEGWDNDLYVVGNEEWVFRFPKRAERVPWLWREIAVVDRVAQVLGPLVPRFEHVGVASEDFPYPFVGYRFVPGLAADRIDPLTSGLAREIGGVLARLHAIDPSGVPPTPAGWEDEPAVPSRIARLVGLAEPVLARLPRPARTKVEPYLAGAVVAPSGQGPDRRRLCHNDISAEHLIVEPAGGRLAGLLDWTDAMVTDPVADFVGLITVGGYGFIGAALSEYADTGRLAIDHRFWERLVWWCRELTLTWLMEAIDEHQGHLERQLEWVARAFAEPPGT